MDAHYQRGLMLLEQSRNDMAEKEFRQSVAADPQNAYPRTMLALTLANQERYAEAEAEIAEALRLEPSAPFVHYIRAKVLFGRVRLKEAEQAIRDAIELDPEDADFRALLASILLNQKRWQEALDASEEGLALDAEHVDCTNLRAIALVQLGRRSEAGATIDAALAKNPENSDTHANQGWTCLHNGEYEKALEHFKESLRLDPENEWAREGILEALKARYFTYSLMLRYFLWMARLSSKAQWMVILGGYFGMRLLSGVRKSNPALEPWIFPIQLVYLVFVFLTWTAEPLFNMLLRFNKFGRMVLNDQEITASNWVGGFVGVALLAVIVGLTVYPPALLGGLVFGFGVLPVAGVFKCQPGWPRFTMAAYTIAVVGCGILALVLGFGTTIGLEPTDVRGARAALIGVFILGMIGSSWIATILMMQRVKK